MVEQGGDPDDWPIYIPTDQPVMSKERSWCAFLRTDAPAGVGQVVDSQEEPGPAKPGSWDTVEGEEAESLIQKMIQREMQEKERSG